MHNLDKTPQKSTRGDNGRAGQTPATRPDAERMGSSRRGIGSGTVAGGTLADSLP